MQSYTLEQDLQNHRMRSEITSANFAGRLGTAVTAMDRNVASRPLRHASAQDSPCLRDSRFTSILDHRLERRNRVGGTSGPAGHVQRQQHEHELVAALFGAGGGDRLDSRRLERAPHRPSPFRHGAP